MNKTIDPDICDINFANNINTLISSSKNYASIVEIYPDEISTAQVYDHMKQNKLNSVPGFFSDLNNSTLPTTGKTGIGLNQFDEQFKLYWLEKFWSSHDAVKADVYSLLGASNEYYINFSESIGSITGIEFIKTNAVISWYTPVSTDIEYTIPSTTHNKLSINSKLSNLYLSKLTNILLKTNTRNIIDSGQEDSTEYTSKSPHGCNLITDGDYYERVKSIIDSIKKPIRDSLKGLYDVLIFVRQSVNLQYIEPLKIDINVEGLDQTLTILKNNITNQPSSITNKTILE